MMCYTKFLSVAPQIHFLHKLCVSSCLVVYKARIFRYAYAIIQQN